MQKLQTKVLFERTINGFNEKLVRILARELRKALDTNVLFEETSTRPDSVVSIKTKYEQAVRLLDLQLEGKGLLKRRGQIVMLIEEAEGIIAILDRYIEEERRAETHHTQNSNHKEDATQLTMGGCPVCRKNGINWEEKGRECYTCGIRGDEFDINYR